MRIWRTDRLRRLDSLRQVHHDEIADELDTGGDAGHRPEPPAPAGAAGRDPGGGLLLDGRRLGGHPPPRRLRRRGHQDRGPHPDRHPAPPADLQGRAGCATSARSSSTPIPTAAGCSTTTAATSSASPSTCAPSGAGRWPSSSSPQSSVVSENFAPGVMERWGLTYDRLRELSPDVIYARMSGYGHSGPHAHYRSYGPVVQAVSGLSYISGLPGAGAVRVGPVLHGQPGRLLQLDGPADGDLPPHADGRGHRDRRVGHRDRHQPRGAGPPRRDRQRPHHPPAGLPAPGTASSGPTPRRTGCTRRSATTGGSPSPCSTRRSGRRWWA